MLTDKIALVTGASRGIGLAIAERLAKDGAKVVLTGRNVSALEQLARRIGGTAIAADLGDRSSVAALLGAIPLEVGRIDILVNNAGIAGSAPYDRTDDATWDSMMEVNVRAPFALARALVPNMVKNGWGRVINVASNAGRSGYAYTSAYCASKHALVGLTRALAAELARTPVTVNAVCPGWVKTEMSAEAVRRIADKTKRSMKEAEDELAKMSPQRRLLEANEVAHLCAMLCAEDARGIHGQSIVVDGGQVMA
ncbi:MAG: SDR family oxidoreductase [Polyangiaceae bacterium]|nr:SDR family oxidoreductase [Polyangiaceae bacterium]